MPGQVISNIQDLVNFTLRETPKGKITETLQHTSYFLTQRFFDNGREGVASGTLVEVRARVRASGGARFVNIRQATPNDQLDLSVTWAFPPAYYEEKMNFADQEIRHNRGSAVIIPIVQERRTGAYEAIYNLFENNLPLAPSTATADADHPQEFMGLLYHFPKLGVGVTDTTGGRNGITIVFRDGTTQTTYGVAAFGAAGNAAPDRNDADNARLRSWNATYGGTITPATLATVRNAQVNTKFMTLPKVGQSTLRGDGGSFLVMGHDRANEYEDIVNAGPDDRNGDATPFSGKLRFRGTSVERAPVLDGLTDSPFFGVNSRHTYGRVWAGDHMRETDAVKDTDQLQVSVVGVVGTAQLVCDNPREGGFCIHTVRAA